MTLRSDAAARPTDAQHVRRASWSGLDQASIMGAELVTAVLVWAAIGFGLDRWLSTEPWFTAIGALVGNAAGLYLIHLRSQRMDAAEQAYLDAGRGDQRP